MQCTLKYPYGSDVQFIDIGITVQYFDGLSGLNLSGFKCQCLFLFHEGFAKFLKSYWQIYQCYHSSKYSKFK